MGFASGGGCQQFCFDCLEHRLEEVLFVGEVVVQRTSGTDTGLSHDLLCAGVEVPARNEQTTGGGYQCSAGCFGPLGYR